MLRRPRNWEIRNAGDMQRRRHELNKMLRGDFTSIKKPVELAGEGKGQLEPLLQHWMPQHSMGKPSTGEKHEEQQANLRRHENVKKAIQRQRWVKMLNSSTFSNNQMKNVAKIRKKNANKMGELTGLMQSQKYSTAPKSGSKALLEHLKGRKAKTDVDYSLIAKGEEENG